MERLIERGCGLDVHRDTVAACVCVPGAHGRREQHVRTFGTTTAELLVLRDWLEAHGVTHVAMESTGVYGKPVFSVLEEAFICLLVNAAHIKQVPGRKTDVLDCIWIAQLLEHGLLRGRVMRHRGHKKAVVAVAHAMLRAVYHVLADGTAYRDPGPDYYDRRHAQRGTRRAIEWLERQGDRGVLEPAA
jgi:hypothetical protein